MLKSTPSRSHRSAARTTAIVLVVLVVVGVLVGAGYALLSSSPHPTPAVGVTTSAAVTTAATSVTPSPTALPADVIAFISLPVGTPPSPGSGEQGYPWHALTATLRGPTSVKGGDTPDYRLRLTNPTSAAIALDPCPAYDLRVGLRAFSYGLNCAGAPSTSLEPGASLTFDLPVPVPRSLSGGSTTIVWSLGWQPDKASPQAKLVVTVG